MEIIGKTGAEAVEDATGALLRRGVYTEGRHGQAYELAGVTVSVDRPLEALVERDGFDPRVAAAEALHLISGLEYGPRIRELTRDLGSNRWQPGKPSAAVRLRDQLPVLIWELGRSPGSRQAQAPIARVDDLANGLSDYVCATGVQFLRRGRGLDLVVTWRSNDAWHGLPYNLFAFGQLQATVARAIGEAVGRLTFQIGSFHLYDRHVSAALAACTRDGGRCEGLGGRGEADSRRRWQTAARRAGMLLQGPGPFDPTEGEQRMAALLT